MSSSSSKCRARSDSDPSAPPSSDNESVGGGASRAPVKRARVANIEPDVGDDEPAVAPQVAVDDPIAATAAIAQDALANVQPGRLTAAQKRARFLAKYDGMTPVEILDAVSKTWRSKVYDHFKPPKVILAAAEGPNVHRFTCKIHPGIWVDRSDYEDSTGNLRRHVLKCEPAQTPESEAITAFAAGSTYSAARVRYYLALWCARHHRLFLAVEDAEFRALLRMLYGRVEIPSRVTVSRNVQLIMHHCKLIVIALFKAYPGRIHICVDGWTSPNILAFLGITAHWHHEGKIAHIILDFVRLTSSHTGKYLAEKLIECLKEFAIEGKVLSVTCDNAENNTTMLKEMHVLVPKFRGTLVRVRCFGHVLNLVVKGILSQFGRQHLIEGGDDDVDDEDAEAAQEADKSREAADQAILDSLDDEELGVDVTADDVRLAAGALSKILKLSRKVWNSPTIRAELATLAADAKLNSEVLIRSVKTRWNTVTEVLGRALKMRMVLTDLCDMVQFNKAHGVRLRQFVLSDEEWVALQQLHDLLDPFLFATKEISTSGRTLVHQVIPYIDVLTSHVDNFKKDDALLPAIRAAAQRGRVILDKYYSLTDDSIVYRIAMILHPRYKMQYFRDQDWEEEWIAVAVDLVRSEWTTYYKVDAHDAALRVPSASANVGSTSAAPAANIASSSRSAPTNNASANDDAQSSAHTSAAATGSGRRSAQRAARLPSSQALFATISNRSQAARQDELDAYLEAPPLSTVEDPLEYWDLVAKSSNSPLARMAIDFLTAQATSTDSERSFSRGRLTVSRLRHSLSDESVRTGTVLGSWSNIPELVPEAEVVQLLTDKSRKGKSRAAPAAAAPAGADVIEID
ncbi:hypothetical protein VTO73DRAFT_13963 [Trametes versicolor]